MGRLLIDLITMILVSSWQLSAINALLKLSVNHNVTQTSILLCLSEPQLLQHDGNKHFFLLNTVYCAFQSMLRNSVLDDEKLSQAVSSKSGIGKVVFRFLLWAILSFVLLALSALN